MEAVAIIVAIRGSRLVSGADQGNDIGRMVGAAIKGVRYFVEMYEPVDMLFDVLLEGRGTTRVGTGRLGKM